MPICLVGPPECEKSPKDIFGLCENAWFLWQPIMRFSKLGLRFEDGLVSYLGVPIEQFANNEKLSWGQGAECTVSLIRPRTIMTV